MAERLALPASDHGVAGLNPPGGEILPEPKWRFIAQSLSCSHCHRLEMTEILLKRRKTLTHPSILTRFLPSRLVPPAPPSQPPSPTTAFSKLHTFFWYLGLFLPLQQFSQNYSCVKPEDTIVWHCMMMYLSVILMILTIIIWQLRTHLHLDYSISGTPRSEAQDVSVTTGMNDSLLVNPFLNWINPKSQTFHNNVTCERWRPKFCFCALDLDFPKNKRQDYVKVRHQLSGNEDFSCVLAQL